MQDSTRGQHKASAATPFVLHALEQARDTGPQHTPRTHSTHLNKRVVAVVRLARPAGRVDHHEVEHTVAAEGVEALHAHGLLGRVREGAERALAAPRARLLSKRVVQPPAGARVCVGRTCGRVHRQLGACVRALVTRATAVLSCTARMHLMMVDGSTSSGQRTFWKSHTMTMSCAGGRWTFAAMHVMQGPQARARQHHRMSQPLPPRTCPRWPTGGKNGGSGVSRGGLCRFHSGRAPYDCMVQLRRPALGDRRCCCRAPACAVGPRSKQPGRNDTPKLTRSVELDACHGLGTASGAETEQAPSDLDAALDTQSNPQMMVMSSVTRCMS